ncbi:MAG: hypothetical protein OHK0012_28000 [Synechococcales cyanobacterium]
MGVPNELTLGFYHHEIVTVELTNHVRLPVTCKSSEFVRKIDGWHEGLPGEVNVDGYDTQD